ncbi:MAG: efflux RND transporter permease subunit [Planctomycetota bacterium]|nr:efflux RND transporter permease subunit [Planctomycetota bacterium]
MRKLAEICIHRPVFAAMIILALVVVGSAAYMRLGVDRFPAVDIPTVSVRITLRGASPEEMENEVADRVERAVNTVEGIEELRTVCGAGTCFVMATFALSRDVDVAAQDVRDRISTVIKDLPDDTDPPVVSKFDNDSSPILSLALSGNRSVRELTELADKSVRLQLERCKGVGAVAINGGLERTINIWADANKLAAYQLPITAVRDALVRQNSDVPGGNVTGPIREQTLRTMGRFTDSAAFNDLVIKTIKGAPIRVRDIGYAEDGTREQRSISRLNGVPTVSLEVRRQSKANTVEVIESVKAALQRIVLQLPPDVNLVILRDQSRYIYSALHEINIHLVLGSVFASIVVLLFMRSWQSTIIAGIAIPASVISTFGMMAALNFTLNSVTMLALVLMVGVVIDDAIVVLENIFRWVEEKKISPFEAAAKATGEIALAVLATTLSLVIIFIPVSFMSSISGRFLYQFGITAAVAVMISLLVSFTLTPMMCPRLLRFGTGAATHGHDIAYSRRGFYRIIDILYTWMLTWTMRFRFPVAIFAVAIIACSIPLYRMVKQEYTPSDVDEAEFVVNVNGKEGTGLNAMDAAMLAIDSEVRSHPAVRITLATSGGGFIGGVNQGNIFVRIASHDERVFRFGRLWKGLKHGDPMAAFRGNYSQRDVMQQLRARLRKFPDVRIAVRSFPAFNIGGANSDIDFLIRGPDIVALSQYSETLRNMTREQRGQPPLIPGIVDADTTLRLDKPELRVNIDRARAADLGVDALDIGTALRLMVGGDTEVCRYLDPAVNEVYDVQLRLTESNRNDVKLIDNLFLPRAGGGLVQFSNLAKLQFANAPSRIERLDRQRTVALRAGIAPGYAMADRLQALQNAVKNMNLPAGYTTRVTGRGRELERTFVEFAWAFLLSIIFMYMILACLYESLLHPLTILLSLPLAVPFALLSLYLTGGTLNLYSALGILVLFGVVKKNSILQIDHMNNLRQQGMDRASAILQANRDRLRPILMTTLALVAGMLPLAVGSGPGAEERRAVATVVIGGQTLSLLLTLLVTPVAYSIFDDAGVLFRRFVPSHHHLAPAAQEPLPSPELDTRRVCTADRSSS